MESVHFGYGVVSVVQVNLGRANDLNARKLSPAGLVEFGVL